MINDLVRIKLKIFKLINLIFNNTYVSLLIFFSLTDFVCIIKREKIKIRIMDDTPKFLLKHNTKGKVNILVYIGMCIILKILSKTKIFLL